MTAEYKLHLLMLDDDRVICIDQRQAVLLPKMVAGYARQLIEAMRPAEKEYAIIPPARSAELALKANGPAVGEKYAMTKTMVTLLNSIAALNESVTNADMVTLLSWKEGTVSSKLSMLTRNGYLVRTDVGKYMASPKGQLFLQDRATN